MKTIPRRDWIALIILACVVPMLGWVCFILRPGAPPPQPAAAPFSVTLLGGILLLIAGGLLLRRRPDRNSLISRVEHITQACCDGHGGPALQADVSAIQHCVGQVASELESRLQAAGRPGQSLECQILRAVKLDSLTAMAIGVSHDFNNYLAAITGNSSIVIRDLPPDSPNAANARQIEASAQQALDLSNQLLIFTGRARANLTLIHLSHLLEDMLPAMKAYAPAGIVTTVHRPDDLPYFKGDDAQIRSALMSLFANASDFILSGTGSITMTVGSAPWDTQHMRHVFTESDTRPATGVFFEITDTGCGMTQQQILRAFDPFFTTKIRARGMGLPVVLGVARSHHGAVGIRSGAHSGTTVRLMMPAEA